MQENQLLAENEYLELIYGAMIEAMYGDHPLVLRKYVQALREETRKSILDKSARAVKTMIAESSGKGREIIRLLENKLWFDKAAVTMMSVQCGMGKSTAISYVIRDVIEYGDGEGILIAPTALSA